MKNLINKILATEEGSTERKDLMIQFILVFLTQFASKGKFYWAMSDPKEAIKKFGHQEIGWFNSKTEEFLKAHPDDAQDLLVKKLIWASNHDWQISIKLKDKEFKRQLICIEVKLMSEYYTPENNFYLKIGLIPDWDQVTWELAGFHDKPVVDFHY